LGHSDWLGGGEPAGNSTKKTRRAQKKGNRLAQTSSLEESSVKTTQNGKTPSNLKTWDLRKKGKGSTSREKNGTVKERAPADKCHESSEKKSKEAWGGRPWVVRNTKWRKHKKGEQALRDKGERMHQVQKW